MNIFDELGELAIGSRLKRLSDAIMRDGVKVYQANDIEFEPRWFPVFYLLQKDAPLSVMEIAQQLDISHPAVSQTVRDLERKQLIVSVPDELDGRRKLLSLSEKGRALLPRIRPVWQDIANSIHQMLSEHNNHLLSAIDEVERSFFNQGFAARVQAVTRQRQLDSVEILNYESQYKQDFADINYAWIEKYFTVEEVDRDVLDHPERILANGGHILFARYDNRIVGTCALINMGGQKFELAKMGVLENVRGMQIGKKLGLAAIETARNAGGRVVFLESNKKLTPAISLYKRLGFMSVNQDHSESAYQRCNIAMELELN